ncbi:hypothetical protein AC1031_001546 [Aphanomyces cochlioides]|nr:hypothetical protein AC1031_001546 [Aphanomyces cochlioides]
MSYRPSLPRSSVTVANSTGSNPQPAHHKKRLKAAKRIFTNLTTLNALVSIVVIAVGNALARVWQTPLFVTSCTTNKAGWTALVFLASTTSFPSCQPQDAQFIHGMALLETTVRDGKDLFLLSAFTDVPSLPSVLSVNSDGSSTMFLADSIVRLLISQDGAMTTKDPLNGTAYVQTMQPLGTRYEITSFASAIVLDPSEILADGRFFVGRLSRKAVRFAWTVGHDVRNWQELLAIQLVLVLTNMFLFGADFYLTNQGLHGFIAKTPILTYDLTAGTEQRCLGSLLPRLLSLVPLHQRRAHLLRVDIWHAGLLLSGDLVDRLGSGGARHVGIYLELAESIHVRRHVQPELVRLWHSQHAHEHVHVAVRRGVGGISSCSILFGTLCQWNSATQRRISLDASHAIKIGNKLFVKPSLQVVLGYASIVPRGQRDTKSQYEIHDKLREDGDKTPTTVSVYALLPCLLGVHKWLPRWSAPKPLGSIIKHEFRPEATRFLSQDMSIDASNVSLRTILGQKADISTMKPRSTTSVTGGH